MTERSSSSPYENYVRASLSLHEIAEAASSVRSLTLRSYLPTPGLISLPDGYYTAWGYVEEDGKQKVIFNDDEPTYRSVRAKSVFPYFKLNRDDALRFNHLLRQEAPLTEGLLEALCQASQPEEYPLVQDFKKLSLWELSRTASSFAQAIMQRESVLPQRNQIRTARLVKRNLFHIESMRHVLSSKLEEVNQFANPVAAATPLSSSFAARGSVK